MRIVTCFLIVLGCASLPAADAVAAGVYKCRSGARLAGAATVVYQQLPCPHGTELQELAQSQSTVSVIPFEFSSPAPPPVVKPPPRTAKAAPKPERRAKADADRRTSDAAVVERRHVRDGMSDGEVLARLGPPDLQAGKNARKMRWTYLPAAGDPQTVTLVRFEDGKVVGVERTTMR